MWAKYLQWFGHHCLVCPYHFFHTDFAYESCNHGLPAMALGIDPPERDVMQKNQEAKMKASFRWAWNKNNLQRYIYQYSHIDIIHRGIYVHEGSTDC